MPGSSRLFDPSDCRSARRCGRTCGPRDGVARRIDVLQRHCASGFKRRASVAQNSTMPIVHKRSHHAAAFAGPRVAEHDRVRAHELDVDAAVRHHAQASGCAHKRAYHRPEARVVLHDVALAVASSASHGAPGSAAAASARAMRGRRARECQSSETVPKVICLPADFLFFEPTSRPASIHLQCA
jgi:hypothetical protein